jgi:hypothetical protein
MFDSTPNLYSHPRWREVRELALKRDGARCTVARLLGGQCGGSLHAHHIVAVADRGRPFDLDNVGTTCAHHHPMWEALRRELVRRLLAEPRAPRCTHDHRTRQAREICERRLARRAAARQALAA